MRRLLPAALAAAALTAAVWLPHTPAAQTTAAARPPSIVLIHADDLGWGDVSINGQQKFTTPNIDRLAKEGVRFTHYYSGSTVCAPSRAAMTSS